MCNGNFSGLYKFAYSKKKSKRDDKNLQWKTLDNVGKLFVVRGSVCVCAKL